MFYCFVSCCFASSSSRSCRSLRLANSKANDIITMYGCDNKLCWLNDYSYLVLVAALIGCLRIWRQIDRSRSLICMVQNVAKCGSCQCQRMSEVRNRCYKLLLLLLLLFFRLGQSITSPRSHTVAENRRKYYRIWTESQCHCSRFNRFLLDSVVILSTITFYCSLYQIENGRVSVSHSYS